MVFFNVFLPPRLKPKKIHRQIGNHETSVWNDTRSFPKTPKTSTKLSYLHLDVNEEKRFPESWF